ncbi:MAG TPA: ABC transporter permease [Acidimicrobiales bacterium]|nr:ABC transporter permease [Acidimicrobiales bacterium]
MTLARTLATARRVLGQLRHDPRTLALLLAVPILLMGLLAWMLPGPVFDRWGAPLLGIFPLTVMFLVTSVATLRERTGGTLERLLSMPLGKGDLIFGYAAAFALLALAQATIVSLVTFGVFELQVRGSAWLVSLVAVVDALLGTALGLFVSAFAATEFQAVQFMPVVLIPQLLLCGLLVGTDALPDVLRWISQVLPLTYAVEATREVLASPGVTATFRFDVLVIAAYVIALLGLGAATLRRRTP